MAEEYGQSVQIFGKIGSPQINHYREISSTFVNFDWLIPSSIFNCFRLR